MSDLLNAIGIKIPDLAAGFGGGVVNALFFQHGKPLDVVASILGGAITANFMAATFAHVAGTETGVAGFVVGVTAMAVCQGLLVIVKGWMAKLQRGGPDA